MKSLIVLVMTTVGIGQVVVVLSCTESHLKECLGDMLDAAKAAQAGSGLPSYTVDEFRKVCIHFDASKTCLKDIRDSCYRKADIASLDSLKAMFEYLCDDPHNFNVYVNNSECFLDKSLISSVTACTNTYKTNIAGISRYASAQTKLGQLCSYTNQFVDYHESVIKKSCGKQAGDLVRGIDKRAVDASFRAIDFNCAIPAPTDGNNGATAVTTPSDSNSGTTAVSTPSDSISGATTVIYSFGAVIITALLVFRNYL